VGLSPAAYNNDLLFGCLPFLESSQDKHLHLDPWLRVCFLEGQMYATGHFVPVPSRCLAHSRHSVIGDQLLND
jgi:hypothetical protein